MKRVDALILKEMTGPWLFGVGIFTVLIMAGTYLFRLTSYLSEGIGMMTVAELTVLLLPGIMAKTFPMAVLLATLLAFGRLSSDSEVVALRAAGTSLGRVMLPVAVFSSGVALLAFGFNEIIVPNAALRATGLQAEIAKTLGASGEKPTFYPQYEEGRLVAMVTARDFSLQRGSLSDAHVVTYDTEGQPSLILFAKELLYTNENDWRIQGGGRLLTANGQSTVQLLGDAWPTGVAKLTGTPEDILTASLRDLDSFSMRQMRDQIEKARANPLIPRSQVANLEYGYWNKIALPLASVVYALLGAPLGIRNHRTGAAVGFWLSVIIIFGYMLLANFMAIFAQGGAIPAYLASFTPLAVGMVVAAWVIQRKNI